MNDELDASVWGPKFWFFLHTIAFTYPDHPNDTLKKKYYEFIQNLPLFIPNTKMGIEFEKLLDVYPVTPYLDSNLSFIKWIHFIHNKINKNLGKPTISLTEYYKMHHEHYRPVYVKDLDAIKWRDKLIYLGVVVCLSIFIALLFRG